jgi:hypothetical protein
VYRFAGFFAKPSIGRPTSLPEGAVWRSIAVPFLGVGVRLPDLLGQSPDPAEVEYLLRQVGLNTATDWLYLIFDCWAGRIDSVYGLGARGGHAFGPTKESDLRQVRSAYLELMGEFGVRPADALAFPPFVRGFWGDA